jgi:hypothetical protein
MNRSRNIAWRVLPAASKGRPNSVAPFFCVRSVLTDTASRLIGVEPTNLIDANAEGAVSDAAWAGLPLSVNRRIRSLVPHIRLEIGRSWGQQPALYGDAHYTDFTRFTD